MFAAVESLKLESHFQRRPSALEDGYAVDTRQESDLGRSGSSLLRLCVQRNYSSIYFNYFIIFIHIVNILIHCIFVLICESILREHNYLYTCIHTHEWIFLDLLSATY